MPNTFLSFLNANKVLLLGLLAAIGTTVQQFAQSGPINYAVLAWAVVVAAIGFLANNIHGQAATILSSLLPTVDVIYESTKDNAAISWGHMALLAGVAVVGAITGPAKGVVAKMIIVLLVSASLLSTTASAQSPFKQEHKVVLKASPFVRAAVVQADSFYNAWRFTGNIAVYNYTFGAGGSSALTGAEYGYEHQKWNYTTDSWDVLWSVNAAWFPINTALPITLANMQTFGVTFGFKNPLPIGNSVIQLGPDFNPHSPKNQQFGILATVGILFN